MEVSGIKIVMIGGGTGSFTLLSALKSYVQNLTAIVNMVDDGGSTGILRDELGTLPPGDVRQCLVALSRSSAVMRELFNYRFPEGTFAGHSFGNLFLTALEKTTGNFAEAVNTASKILNVSGQVIPVTLKNIRLAMYHRDGRLVEGEKVILETDFKKHRPELFLKPAASINPKAREAILEADLVVIAPGNLYTSLIPALLPKGMKEALAATRGKVVYVCNLVTKPGQTDGYKVHDFAAEIERYGGEGVLDYVVYNNQKPPKHLLKKYAKDGEYWVEFNKRLLDRAHYKAKGDNFVSGTIFTQSPNDILMERTFIRHDADKVARLLMKLCFS